MPRAPAGRARANDAGDRAICSGRSPPGTRGTARESVTRRLRRLTRAGRVGGQDRCRERVTPSQFERTGVTSGSGMGRSNQRTPRRRRSVPGSVRWASSWAAGRSDQRPPRRGSQSRAAAPSEGAADGARWSVTRSFWRLTCVATADATTNRTDWPTPYVSGTSVTGDPVRSAPQPLPPAGTLVPDTVLQVASPSSSEETRAHGSGWWSSG
jgi:hypothetical protein